MTRYQDVERRTKESRSLKRPIRERRKLGLEVEALGGRKVSLCGRSGCTGTRSCRLCKNAYMRAWRKAGRERLSGEQARRALARSYANVYQRRGRLKPEPCEVCGENAEKHHDDYTRPLGVRWLCGKHHREHHRGVTPPPALVPEHTLR